MPCLVIVIGELFNVLPRRLGSAKRGGMGLAEDCDTGSEDGSEGGSRVGIVRWE